MKPQHLNPEDSYDSLDVVAHGQGLICPKCKAELESIRVGKLEIERCNACFGIWFDALEWKEANNPSISQQLDIGNPEVGKRLDPITGTLCPKCQTTPLTRLSLPEHKDVHIDKCARCYGAFFDAGELMAVSDVGWLERIKKIFSLLG